MIRAYKSWMGFPTLEMHTPRIVDCSSCKISINMHKVGIAVYSINSIKSSLLLWGAVHYHSASPPFNSISPWSSTHGTPMLQPWLCTWFSKAFATLLFWFILSESEELLKEQNYIIRLEINWCLHGWKLYLQCHLALGVRVTRIFRVG